MSSTPDSLPSFGLTLPSASNTTIARDLFLPFRRDINAPWQALSPPLNFKNPQNSRAQATFCYANDASNNFSDVDVETQSFSSVNEISPRQCYGQKFADAVLRMLLAIKAFGRRIIRQ